MLKSNEKLVSPYLDYINYINSLKSNDTPSIIPSPIIPSRRIPSNIFQTWYTKDLCPELEFIRNKMLEQNPEWSYSLFNDNEMDSYVKNNFSKRIQNAYFKLNIVTARADLWRYLILYKEGGVYLDMDSSINQPLKNLIKPDDEAIITAEGNPDLYVQWALIFNKGHPILMNVLNIVVNNIENNTYPDDILNMTGPGAYTRGINEYHKTLYSNTITHASILPTTDITYDKGVQYRLYGIDYNEYFSFHHPYYTLLYKNNSHWSSQKNKLLHTMDNLELLQVYTFYKKIRLGSDTDGGYVVGELYGGYDCYISAGVSTEESFSRDFINKYNMNKYNSFAFDGTIDAYPTQYTQNISYFKKNISNYNDDKNTDLIYLITQYKNIFLKMDIEAGEYPWLLKLDETQLKRFKQIVIEFHGITNDSWGHKYTDKILCLEKLANTHYLIHAHGNNNSHTVDGIPDVIELTYINKDFFDSVPDFNTEPLPIPNLDFPNDPSKDDISLKFYPFIGKGNMEAAFTNIYVNKAWGDNNIVEYSGSSGEGSGIQYNKEYISFLKKFINEMNINSVVDIGCGDFRCGISIYDSFDILYTGYDVYKKVIEFNLKQHSLPKYFFTHLDVSTYKERIVSADMCILKDIIQHWSLDNIYKFLDYLIDNKKFKYILIINCCDQIKDNTDISDGGFRPLSCEFFPLKKYNPVKLYNYNTKEISLIQVSI